MRRPLTALVFLVLTLLLGSSMAAGAATPNDKACRKLVSGSVSTKELLAYDVCRFDKIDAQLAAMNAAGTSSGSPTSVPASTTTAKASPLPSSTTTSAAPTGAPSTVPTTTPTTAPAATGKPGPSNTGVPAGVTL